MQAGGHRAQLHPALEEEGVAGSSAVSGWSPPTGTPPQWAPPQTSVQRRAVCE